MRYALLIYSNLEARGSRSPEEQAAMNRSVAAVLERPDVTSWLRLQDDESATTIQPGSGRTLLTDGPFVDSKDFLAGLIVVEAADLDGALGVADELYRIGAAVAIEVRPVREDPLLDA